MVTKFHDLCVDVVLELLSYFNIHEIFYSFCLLIPCIPTLLINGRVKLHVRSNNSYFIRWILPHIKLTQVFSLDVPTRPYNPSIFRYSALRSLVLHDVDDPLSLLQSDTNWPPCYLERLSLHIRNQNISNIGTRVLEKVFQLKRLKHFELHESKSSFKMVELYDELNFPSTFQSSNLQSLIITVYCNWKTLLSILHYSHNLHSFQIHSSYFYSQNLPIQLDFPSIRKLNLTLDGLHGDMFIEILRHAPYLRHYKLHCSSFIHAQCNIDFFRSDTWIRLLDTYTPQLRVLDIDITFRLDSIDNQIIEMVNEDFSTLNFKIEYDLESRNQSWNMKGIFYRKKQ